MSIDEILDHIYPLPEASRQALKVCISKVSYPKGYILLKADKIETNIYFIARGIVRAFANKGDNEVTFWFGSEGQTVLSMKSYVDGAKGYEHIQLLEDCRLYQLSSANLQDLFSKDIHIANWGRKFAEQELVKTEERLIDLQFRTATERYTALLKENPDLIRRVQLGQIASYLGITRVSLSRIRAEIR